MLVFDLVIFFFLIYGEIRLSLSVLWRDSTILWYLQRDPTVPWCLQQELIAPWYFEARSDCPLLFCGKIRPVNL